jgi:hypothetical protein
MPSRNRPKKSLETFRKWSDTVSTQFILSLDQDDPLLSEYLDIYPDYFKLKPMPPGEGKWGRCFSDSFVIIVNNNRSAVDAINRAAEVCIGKFIVVVSDDTEPVDNWYTNLYNVIGNKKDFILKTQDGIQNYIITNPILDQDYYNRFGHIYHPDFQHLFCDTYLTCVADITGRKITSDLMFKHNHYSVNGTQPDELHKRNDATWKQGEETFIRLMKEFTPEQRAKITDTGMKNWLRNHGVR